VRFEQFIRKEQQRAISLGKEESAVIIYLMHITGYSSSELYLHMQDKVNDEILNTINGTAEYNDYACDESDVGTGKVVMLGGLQRMLSIGDQTITTGIEPALVYKAKSDEDIWFADTIITEDGKEKILIYPMTHFKGHKDVWSEGLDSVYFYVAGGRYGAYDGTCWNYFNKK
jgi:hypothetical protein